jgi:proteasome accessory factor B
VSQAKSERLMNLVIALLVARTYLPKARLRQVVGGYGDQSDEAFERMFERDKDELRELGIPIETGSEDPFAPDEEIGYRIRRSDFELPPVSLEPDEAAVLGLAARVWQHATLAEATGRALLKLRAAGVETDTRALAAVEPRLAAEEPAFWPLWEAVRDRRRVSFDYRKPGSGSAEHRRLEPWSVLSWHGRWYVVGRDRDRVAPRMFRLSRVAGPVSTGPPGAFPDPGADEVRRAAASLAPPPVSGAASVRVRHGAAWGLRRRAVETRPDGAGWDVVEVPYADAWLLAEEVAGYGSAALVLAPEDVRAHVLARLRAVAGSGAT